MIADINVDNAQATAKELAGYDVETLALQSDISKWEDVQSMVSKAVERFGTLDIAVNNAGVISIKSVE